MNVQSGIPLLNWTCFYQEKGMEELKQCLFLTTMELENTRFKAEEELKLKDMQIIQLKYFLEKTIKEKNEAEEKCQRIILEKMLVHQQQQNHQSFAHLSRNSSSEDEPRKGIEFCSSDCDESIVSSPNQPLPPPPPPPTALAPEDTEFQFLQNRALPEKGKLLEAVMKAGPLLQTLMLAGPLPEWRHPPPPLDTCQIPPPPLTISSSSPPGTGATNFLHQESNFTTTDASNLNFINNCGSSLGRKRGLNEGSDTSPTESKYQRLIIP